MNSPNHVAIIMDGNGRWGLKKKNSRNYGHKKGLETVETIIDASIEEKIQFLTLFVFSTENWKRPKNEIKYLFQLLEYYLNKKITHLQKKKIKIKIFGNLDKFPKSLKYKLFNVEKVTKKNSTIQINMALNYGSRQELIDCINKLKKKKLVINEENINNNLYTRNIPDPEILIRTGNTNRISNFLIWQSIYSEIFFVKKMWPEFSKIDFKKIIKKYKKINRNFGGIDDRDK
tara:strand:- start:990 stop:1682 length:693 start_codon:yes stop_codon:yes gene_type:complete